MTDPDRPLDTVDELLAHVTDLIRDAIRRQCWLLFFDLDHRPLPILVPIDGMPVDPDPAEIARFAEGVRTLIEHTGATEIAVAWERPGGSELRMQEADWAVGIAAAGLPIRAQMLVSDDGVRVIDPAFESLVAG